MDHSLRYQAKKPFATAGSVKTFEGVDPLTGLPVLIYRFPARPTLAVGDLDSENVPGVLASAFDGEGRLVVAYSREYAPLKGPLPVDKLMPLALGSARALLDAAEAGVVHGDIRPERFLVAGGDLLLEGYGAVWDAPSATYRAPELGDGPPSPAGDVYAWAGALRSALGSGIPERLEQLFTHCLSQNPEDRPSAEAIHRGLELQVESLARASAASVGAYAGNTSPPPPPANGSQDPEDTEPILIRTNSGTSASAGSSVGSSVGSNVPSARLGAPAVYKGANNGASETTNGAVNEKPARADEGRVFVRDLPPGGVYRAGTEEGSRPPAPFEAPPDIILEDERRGGRRLILLVALLVGAALLAVLAFLGRDAGVTGPRSAAAPTYALRVSVEPRSIANAVLLAIVSPDGSSLNTGDEIAYVPGRASLDAAGVWRLQARYQDRLSAPVSVRVPEETAVTLVFPEVPTQ